MWTLIPIVLILLGLLAIFECSTGPPVPEVKPLSPGQLARQQLFTTRVQLVILALGVIGTWLGLGLYERRARRPPPPHEVCQPLSDHGAASPNAPTDRRTRARCERSPTP